MRHFWTWTRFGLEITTLFIALFCLAIWASFRDYTPNNVVTLQVTLLDYTIHDTDEIVFHFREYENPFLISEHDHRYFLQSSFERKVIAGDRLTISIARPAQKSLSLASQPVIALLGLQANSQIYLSLADIASDRKCQSTVFIPLIGGGILFIHFVLIVISATRGDFSIIRASLSAYLTQYVRR